MFKIELTYVLNFFLVCIKKKRKQQLKFNKIWFIMSFFQNNNVECVKINAIKAHKEKRKLLLCCFLILK